MQNHNTRAIYRINLDANHPFSYGLGKTYYSLKTDRKIYEPFVKGWNVGLINEKSLMAGVVGKKAREELKTGAFNWCTRFRAWAS